jgi:hypothetical protein
VLVCFAAFPSQAETPELKCNFQEACVMMTISFLGGTNILTMWPLLIEWPYIPVCLVESQTTWGPRYYESYTECNTHRFSFTLKRVLVRRVTVLGVVSHRQGIPGEDRNGRRNGKWPKLHSYVENRARKELTIIKTTISFSPLGWGPCGERERKWAKSRKAQSLILSLPGFLGYWLHLNG